MINGAALTALRERSGLSVSDLARTAGVARNRISEIEHGHRPGTPAQAKALAVALKVPILAILAVPAEVVA